MYRRDRGAVAVEFALVLPLLVALTFGIIAFGQAYHVQTVLDNAAREAVREYVLTDATDPFVPAQARAEALASTAMTTSPVQYDVLFQNPDLTFATECGPSRNAIFKVSAPNFTLLGGIGVVTLTGSASMRCFG